MPTGIEDLNQPLMWVTRGENCPICNSMAGRVYSKDMWMSAGIWPGFHQNCDCLLKKVPYDSTLSNPDIFGMDLDLFLESIQFGWIFQINPNFFPFSWSLAAEIQQAHLTYGAQVPLSDVIGNMFKDYEGFFRRSSKYDRFFQWRVFRTVMHVQQITGYYEGYNVDLYGWWEDLIPRLKWIFGPLFWFPTPNYTRYKNLYLSQRAGISTLKPDSLKPVNILNHATNIY